MGLSPTGSWSVDLLFIAIVVLGRFCCCYLFFKCIPNKEVLELVVQEALA